MTAQRTAATVLVGMACMAGVSPAIWLGWDSVGGETTLTCPICDHVFPAVAWGRTLELSEDDEHRPVDAARAGPVLFETCPKCFYSGFDEDFREGETTPTLPQCLRVRDALAGVDKSRFPPAVTWFPLEKIRLAETCALARRLSPSELRAVYSWGAWLSDDAGEDALGQTYRRKAAAQIERELADKTLVPYDRHRRGYLRAAFLRSLGKRKEADDAFTKLRDDIQTDIAAQGAKVDRHSHRIISGPPEGFRSADPDRMDLALLKWLRQRAELQLALPRHAQAGAAQSRKLALAGTVADKRAYVRLYASADRAKAGPALTAIRRWLGEQKKTKESGLADLAKELDALYDEPRDNGDVDDEEDDEDDISAASFFEQPKPKPRPTPAEQAKRVAALTPKDLPRLRKLAASQKPAELWVLAGLARLGQAGAVAAYEKRALAAPPKRKKKQAKYVVARRRRRAVLDAATIHCTPRLRTFVTAELGRTDDPKFIGGMVRFLASRPDRRDECRKLVAPLLRRPTPLAIKLAMIDVRRAVKMPELDAVVGRWRTSRNQRLAQAAAAAGRKGATP